MLPYLRHWDGQIYWAFSKYYFTPFSKTQDLKTKKFITNRFIRFITINDISGSSWIWQTSHQSIAYPAISHQVLGFRRVDCAPRLSFGTAEFDSHQEDGMKKRWNKATKDIIKTNTWHLGYHAKDMVVFCGKLFPKPFQTHMFHDVCRFHTVFSPYWYAFQFGEKLLDPSYFDPHMYVQCVHISLECQIRDMGGSINGGTPNWMLYHGRSY